VKQSLISALSGWVRPSGKVIIDNRQEDIPKWNSMVPASQLRTLILAFISAFSFQTLAVAADLEPEETLLFAVHRNEIRTGYYVPSAHLRDMPLWNPAKETPPVPLPALIATAFADIALKPELASKRWKFDKVEIDELDAFKGRWIYHITLTAQEPYPLRTGERSYNVSGIGLTKYHHVYLLHDGKQIQDRIIKMK
jgi:hypothetical protein